MKGSKLIFFAPLLIIVCTLFTWNHILSLQFIGEGYQYFAPWTYQISARTSLSHDVFARVASMALIPLFKANTSYYMAFTLIIMVISDLLFYIFINIATKSRQIALFSGILFSISFAAKYDMFSNGGYQYFLQRAALLPILLLSLIFLHSYLEKNKIRYFLLSFCLYFFSVLMGFFSTWFLPFVASYPIIYLAIHKVKLRNSFFQFLSPLIYIISNYLIISSSQFVSDRSFVTFLFSDHNFIPGVLHQLAVITLPFSKFGYARVLSVFLYLFGLIYIYKVNRSLFAISLALFIGCIGSLTFNVFLNFSAISGTYDSSRYFYYPYLGVACFWGILLAVFYNQNKTKLALLLLIVFFSFIVIHNYTILKNSLAMHSWNHKANKKALEIVSSWSKDLKIYPSYVYMPTSIGPYGTTFAYEFYSHPDGQFFEERLHPLDFNELANLKVSPERLYVLHYDSVKEVVINQTDESRAILSAIYASKSPNF